MPLPGDSVADRRARAIEDADAQHLRALLCSEPRGHADMYGGFLVPPDDDGADLGVLFWHKDGFSTACGHGTIALGTWAVESGRVAAPDTGSVEVVIDVPSGRVTARVHREAGRVVAVDFVNVRELGGRARRAGDAPRGASVVATVAFGGATYATLPAAAVGLSVAPEHLAELTALGREIKWALDDSDVAKHPTDPRLDGVYGTIWYDDLGSTADGQVHQRNVTVFADGEVDRSPCGSGTCARLAVLHADGRLPGRHHAAATSRWSAAGSPGRCSRPSSVDGRAAVVPQVTGAAYRTGEHRFLVDPHDPLVPGFVLR